MILSDLFNLMEPVDMKQEEVMKDYVPERKAVDEEALDLVFILDKSGSMGGLEEDTIGGFNSMLAKQREEQKKTNCKAYVTTVLFNSEVNIIHKSVPIEKVAPMTSKEYRVGGCTALLDAMGDAITFMDRLKSEQGKALVVVITDGYENSSRRYKKDEIKKLVEAHKKQGWDFVFMGADLSAVDEARDYGFDQENTIFYKNDSRGIAKNFEMCCCIAKDLMHK